MVLAAGLLLTAAYSLLYSRRNRR